MFFALIINHRSGKYADLNSLNQTPVKFVAGRKYKVGTGLILVRTEQNSLDKIRVSSKTTYKKFLRQVLTTEKYKHEIVALQWIPVRIVKENTLAVLDCNHNDDCIPNYACKTPGCFCKPDGHCA